MMNFRNIFAVTAMASAAFAAIPQTILFQGTVSVGGKAVANGKHALMVNLCTSALKTDLAGCVNVKSDTVIFMNGYFSTMLSPNLPFDTQYYLDISIDNSAADSRIPLSSTPYALRSAVSDSAVTAGLATKAILADSASGATRAQTAIKASLADSATGTTRAQTAVRAVLADSATGATRAQTAVKANLADSATGATRAQTAKTAITANYALAMDPTVSASYVRIINDTVLSTTQLFSADTMEVSTKSTVGGGSGLRLTANSAMLRASNGTVGSNINIVAGKVTANVPIQATRFVFASIPTTASGCYLSTVNSIIVIGSGSTYGIRVCVTTDGGTTYTWVNPNN